MELKEKFSKLKNSIEENKIAKARIETNLEQQKNQLNNLNEELKELTGTDDLKQIEELMVQLETKIAELTKEANKIIEEAGL